MSTLLTFPDRKRYQREVPVNEEPSHGFTLSDHVEVAEWMAPRRPWGFRMKFIVLKPSIPPVFLFYAPGRYDNHAYLVSKWSAQVSVTCADGEYALLSDMVSALAFMERGFNPANIW